MADWTNNALNAALQGFADQATFGLAPKASALLASKIYGVPYADALQAVQTHNSQIASDHPYATAAGDVGGIVGGGALLKGVGLADAATGGGRIAQNALVGAGAGAANEAADTGQIDARTGLAGVVGGVGGAALGKAGEFIGNVALNRITPAASSAWRFMSNKLGVDAATLRQRYAAYQAATGARPALAQLLTPVESQRLRATAFTAPDLGSNIRQFADQVPAQDVSQGALETARNRTMNQVMGAPAAPGGPAVRDVPIKLDPAMLADPNFNRAVRANPDIRLEVANSWNPQDGSATVSLNSVDRLREELNSLHSNARGGPYRGLRDQLVQGADAQVPGYANVVQNYSEASKAITGFNHGMSGQSDLQATGAARAALDTPAGQRGFQIGQVTKAGQDAVRAAVPSRSQLDEGLVPGTTEVMRGLAHLTSGSPALGLFHTIRGILPHLSVGEQAIVSRGLLSRDPAVVQDTLGRLQSAGATNDQLRTLATSLGTAAAGAFGGSRSVTGDNEDAPAAPSGGKPKFYYSTTPPDAGAAGVVSPAAPAGPKFYYAQ